jgi:hypothetical protein
MQYLLLIYHDELQWERLSEPKKETVYGGFRRLREDLERKSQIKGANKLQPTSMATTIRVRDGKTSVTDGPFAETKEQLAGYFLVEAADQQDAVDIAARIPVAQTGSIEVRPVMPPSNQS